MPFFDFGAASLRALENTARGAFPEVLLPDAAGKIGGVWEEMEARRVGFDQMTLPRVHFRMLETRPWPGPMAFPVYEQPVELFYLEQTEGGATDDLRTKMGAFIAYVLTHGLNDNGAGGTGASFQVLTESFGIAAYDGEMLNEILLLRNNYTQGGSVSFSFLMGDDGT